MSEKYTVHDYANTWWLTTCNSNDDSSCRFWSFLKESEYTIMWTLLGEKQITNIYDYEVGRYFPKYL